MPKAKSITSANEDKVVGSASIKFDRAEQATDEEYEKLNELIAAMKQASKRNDQTNS